MRNLLHSNTPRARLNDHLAYWADKPNPDVQGFLKELKRRVDAGGSVGVKGLLLLGKLDNLRIIEERQKPRKGGGDATAKKRKVEKAERQAKAKDIYKTLTDKPEHTKTGIIARRMGLCPRTIRSYLKE